ncbi:MAG: hypothetical protein COW48_07400 [Hydrogenophilales bacterium CG17_big_fil_post_rev_8_21_14_2_50_63_12]|nr:MAG: hypothetical protein COW48_07400 [Hydrogenophilales bacterium CG17_big_fil_post_rev_8_21_14_2_50_63_12]PIX97233.1 MAG: hypothetical protein COZ24_06340 [Hydrogenophilales bacterium CG_4_10_14_3_um_filter_63_21]
MPQSTAPHVEPLPTRLPTIRQVPLLACLAWLRSGWADLRAAWAVSLAHGVLFAGLGWLLVTHGWGDFHWTLAFTSGFLIVAPVLATCFYALSRSREKGEPLVSLSRPFYLLRDNAWSLGLFVVMLAMLFSLWERVTAIAVAMTLKADVYAYGHKQVFSYTASILNDPNHLPVVIAFFAVGALFALAAFALTAVALPMIVDRQVDPVTALLTSLSAARRNPLPMLLWAAVIALLVSVGYLTAFIGLIVLFPLLGHATWQAYRGLVEPA